ncbi:MAG: ABC transporter ATP-binding protein [Bacilli bacterium]
MTNYKRLFKFIKGKKRYLVISLIMIIIVQTLNFISPLIVKTILDDCIMGIEYDWKEVASDSDKAVYYNGHYYKQERHLTQDDIVIKDASIVILKTNFYFVDDDIQSGHNELDGNILKVTTDTKTYEYEVTKLLGGEVISFYQPILHTLIIFIVLLFAKSLVTIICTFTQHYSTNKMVNWLARDGRTLAMQSIERLPISEFEKEPAGKTASRITQDVDGLIILYRQLINLIASAILSFIFAYIGMFYLDYRLAFLSLLIYPFVFLWVRLYLKKLKKTAENVNESRSMLTGKINEIINGINILQIFNFKKQTVNEFNEISMTYKKEQLKEVKLSITLGWNMINVMRSFITVLIIVFFGAQSLSLAGITVSAGLIYAYNEYLLKIVNPISIIFTQIGEFEHSHVRIERIHKLIEAPLEDDTKQEIERYKGDIKFENVWFSYVPNEYVLKGVSFDIKAGQMIGLVGHTGSGKTSLMNLLLRFYDLDETQDPPCGHIYVDGKDIKTYSKRTYREHIGIVLQEPVLVRGTIASNIRFGKEDVSDEEIERILISLGGQKILDKFSEGINQPINRLGENLSAGEKQIISLARALVYDPSIIIMDEATSHIDTETEEMIKHALNVVCKNRTVIVIAHRLSTVFNADKIIVLNHGLKVEEGTHEELVAKNGFYANIYRAQVANVTKFKGKIA